MPSMSNVARPTVNEAHGTTLGAAPAAGKAASAAAGDIQGDLAALRDDVGRLTRQIAAMVATRGGASWRKAKSNVEGVITEAQDKGMGVVDAVRAVGDDMLKGLDESLKKRPYATLGLAIGIGFLLGATWRR